MIKGKITHRLANICLLNALFVTRLLGASLVDLLEINPKGVVVLANARNILHLSLGSLRDLMGQRHPKLLLLLLSLLLKLVLLLLNHCSSSVVVKRGMTGSICHGWERGRWKVPSRWQRWPDGEDSRRPP